MAATCNSTVPNSILPNFEPIRDIIVVLVDYLNKEDPIAYEGPRVVTTSHIDFSDAQEQLTSQSQSMMKSCCISNSSFLLRASNRASVRESVR